MSKNVKAIKNVSENPLGYIAYKIDKPGVVVPFIFASQHILEQGIEFDNIACIKAKALTSSLH